MLNNYDYDTILSTISQADDGAELIAKSRSGRDIPYNRYKIDSLAISDLMRRALPERSVWFNMSQCGSQLIFARLRDGERRLLNANFCRARLCPMCQARRSSKARAQMSQIVNSLNKLGCYRYIFLTLTLRNCLLCDTVLSDTLTQISKAWQRLMQRKRVADVVCGYYKSLEITCDLNEHIADDMYKQAKQYYDARGLRAGDINPNFYNAHPHIHAILCVNSRYYDNPGRLYISQAEWSQLWADALRIDYTPILDVRKISDALADNDMQAVLEVTKYCTKSSDLLAGDCPDEMREMALRDLYYGTYGRRYISLGGVIREQHKALGLTDIEDDDDICSDNATLPTDIVGLEGYIWRSGVGGGKYVRDAMTAKMYARMCKDRGY